MTPYPVSVIIPTYNRSGFLVRALESVLLQSRQCEEIIVVDDGSTDDTQRLMDEMCANNKTIIYLKQKNSGPAAARNLGINKASYPYLAFLDSDDHWNKNKIEKQFHLMRENPSYQISHTREKWLRRGEHLNQKKRHIPRHGDIFHHCLELCAVGMSTVMAKKELFKKEGLFNTDLRCCEDYDYWLRVSCTHHFLLVDEPLTIKEGGREDQVSFQYRIGMDKLRITSIMNLLEQATLAPDQEKYARNELSKKARIYGNGCLRHNKSQEGNYYLKLADKYAKKMI